MSARGYGNDLTTIEIEVRCVTRKWVGVDNAWEQEKLEARKMLENAAESPAVRCTHEDGEPSFDTGETRVLRAVYSEAASTQAEQSSGECYVQLPWCTVVSGQIDLTTGGVGGDPVEEANPRK